MSNDHLSDLSFSSFDLPPALRSGIQATGFERCTPIQAQALPHALAGRDIAGQAQTGTGKTAAFLIALFNRLICVPASPSRTARQPRAVILAPTRELAIQIHKDALTLGRDTGFRLGLIYGGTGYDTQKKLLEEGVDVLIGTPGRIIDFFKQHIFDLGAVQVMVLDEADRMFDLGFIKDIRFLLRRMPPPTERLNMLFSATLAFRVMELAYEHMNNPEAIAIEPDKRTVDRVTQVLYHAGKEEKIPMLVNLLRETDARRSMVFVNTRGGCERVAAWLNANGFEAAVLSGDVPQNKREKLLQRFHEGDLPIVVATDVAARGLHIPDVSHVFNFDLPQDAEDYVHRIGRTARAGASGDAVSFACEEYVFSLPEIESYVGHKIPVASMPIELPKLKHPPRPTREEMEERQRIREMRGGRGGRGGGDRGGPRNSSRGGPSNRSSGSRASGSRPSGSHASAPVAPAAAAAPPGEAAPPARKPQYDARRQSEKPAIG